MHKPIIAAINGYAVGGGFSLALSSHIRYCVPASEVRLFEVRGRIWWVAELYLQLLPVGLTGLPLADRWSMPTLRFV